MTSAAFVTCHKVPDLTPDDRLAAAALTARGHRVRPVLWDDPHTDWPAFDAVVLRSCWDYHTRPDAFGAWLAQLAQQYPQVRQFVVGNEPNQPAFWRPQFSRARQLSARTFGPFLAAAGWLFLMVGHQTVDRYLGLFPHAR